MESYNEKVYEKPTKNSDNNFDFSLVDLKLARNYTQGSEIYPVRVITPVGASAQEVRLTDGTDALNINADGSINVTSGTSLNFANNATVASGNTQTVLTAGASGARIKAISVHMMSNNVTGTISITIAGNVAFRQNFNNTVLLSDSFSLSFEDYIPLSNGQTVTITSSVAGLSGYCSVFYI